MKKLIEGYLLPFIHALKRQYEDKEIILLGFSQGAITVNELAKYLGNNIVRYFISIAGAGDSQVTEDQKLNLKDKVALTLHHPMDAYVKERGYFGVGVDERTATTLARHGVVTCDFNDTPRDHSGMIKQLNIFVGF